MPERVLIVRMSAMGDLVQTTPVARGIKRAMPDCHLAWVAQSPFASLLEHNPHLDELIVFPHRHLHVEDLLRTWWELKAGEFTITVDPQGLFKSAMATWISDAPRRIGKEEAREVAIFAYNEISPERTGQTYVSQRYLELCESLGVDQDDYVPEIFLTDADYGPVDELLATNGLSGDRPLVAIAPFAAEARKEWPEDRFARVADTVASALDGQIVIPGSAGERSRAERFGKRLNSGATVLSGETNMRQVAALMERCDLFIGGESGLTHIAYAVGTPLVCIVGPTPVRNGPKGERARTVYAEGVECRPCRRKRCAHRRCLMEVTPEMVMAAVDDLAAEVGLSGPRRARA